MSSGFALMPRAIAPGEPEELAMMRKVSSVMTITEGIINKIRFTVNLNIANGYPFKCCSRNSCISAMVFQ